MKRVLFLAALLVFGFNVLTAAYLKDYPIKVTQPDGSAINCYATGDEYYNFLHTQEGYVIIQGEDGFYYYAEKSGTILVPSKNSVNKSNPETLNIQKWLKPDESVIRENYQNFQKQRYEGKDNQILDNDLTNINIAKKGKINNLIIFISFDDQEEYTDDISLYSNMMNSETGKSFRDYYLQASYGQMEVQTYFCPQSEGTIISIKDIHSRGYYQPYNAQTNTNGYKSGQGSQREKELLNNVLSIANNKHKITENFDSDGDGKIDNVTFIVQGGPDSWSSLLWPHRSWYTGTSKLWGKYVYDYNLIMSDLVKSNDYGLGTLCHEFFHSLGVWDLYHYSYDGFYPTGRWDLMELTANPPQFMCNLLKFQFTGWIDSIPEIKEEGEYFLNPVTQKNGSIYKIKSPYSSNEFLTLEYRKKEGNYDISLPGSGLLVYRINNSYWKVGNSNGPPDEIYLFRPNGDIDNDGNIYSANLCKEVNRTIINDITNPRMFLSNGTYLGIEIYDISECGETISFKIGFIPRTMIVSPSDGETDMSLNPTIKWRDYTPANSFDLQIATDSEFNNIVVDKVNIYDTSYTLTETLENFKQYYARVKWKNNSKTSPWSETVQFSTVLGKPELVYPDDNTDNISIMGKYIWNKVDGADTYQLYISESSDFKTTAFKKLLIKDTVFNITKPLKLNTVYYWKLRAVSSSSSYAESSVYKFLTKENDVVILSQTKSQGVCDLDPVSLKVSVYGNPDKFEWYKNGELLTEASDSIYTIDSFVESNEGNYLCKITCTENNYSINSEVINLSLIEPPKIIETPESIYDWLGNNVKITVVIDSLETKNYSEAIKYQWLKDGNPLTDGSRYDGTDGTDLTIKSLDNDDLDTTYCLMITTSCGDTIFTKKVSVLLGIEDEINNSQYLVISPNPVKDFITVKISSNSNELVQLEIVDIKGNLIQKLWNGYISQGLNTFNFNLNNLNLSSGIYMILYKTNSKIISSKISIIK